MLPAGREPERVSVDELERRNIPAEMTGLTVTPKGTCVHEASAGRRAGDGAAGRQGRTRREELRSCPAEQGPGRCRGVVAWVVLDRGVRIRWKGVHEEPSDLLEPRGWKPQEGQRPLLLPSPSLSVALQGRAQAASSSLPEAPARVPSGVP